MHRALVRAIFAGDARRVAYMVEAGINLNFNFHGASPLARAFGQGHQHIIELLIEHGASLSPNSPGNETLLLQALASGKTDLIMMALNAGYDVHYAPKNHSKPLAKAIHRNRVDIAHLLISHGANKEDLPCNFRWHSMRAETIKFVRELGIQPPSEILAAVDKGEWW